ncbi:hypothetical protein BMF94_1077 [Rhodotorula taiwanensis]|uniref:Amino acid permease/ SLC12A domain-containing protein n=1 Tax=Rhodotorula taiwanensis TaxID=741276 RepID=A0A2S5BGU5_9BASI|nr:hypothetical protein BMF94_1077 [Rhodotorula taiwanensis]
MTARTEELARYPSTSSITLDDLDAVKPPVRPAVGDEVRGAGGSADKRTSPRSRQQAVQRTSTGSTTSSKGKERAREGHTQPDDADSDTPAGFAETGRSDSGVGADSARSQLDGSPAQTSQQATQTRIGPSAPTNQRSREGGPRLAPITPPDFGGPPMPPTPPPPPLDGTDPPADTASAALHSILKRPAPARLSSSSNSRMSFSTASPLVSISPAHSSLPNSTTATALGQLPTLASLSSQDSTHLAPPASPGVLLDDDKGKPVRQPLASHGVLFSTPGTTTSVLPLSSPSIAESNAFKFGQFDLDPTGTFKSWKSSMMGRRSGLYDRKKLAALGFEEELTRDYDFWASWGIALCNIGGLPGCVLGVLTALEAGGGSMYAIAWPLSGLFMVSLAAILGEMVSTWPVAGAMFTWVFRLCRSKKALNPWARYLSWMTGSLLLCSHLLLQIIITWQFAHNIAGVVGLFTEKDYSHWVTIALGWVSTVGASECKALLLTIRFRAQGVVTLSAAIVSSRLSRSPWLWRICGYLILAFFLIINILLLTTATEIRSARYVFTSYSNTTGFSNKSYVYMIGWVLTCVATGMEASAHMAEDTKKPSRTVPLAMFWSVVATYLMGWVSICVLLATMNTDGLDPALQPSIALIANSIPRGYATVILIFVLFSLLFQNVAQLLATSRFIWALSRESALPFSAFFRRLSKKNKTPVHAILATWAIVVPALCLIAINVSILATTMLEGAGITAVSSYLAPVVIYLVCSSDVLRGDGRAQWTLRRLSQPLCVPVALFLATFMVTMCLPTGYPINSLSVSYASAVLVGVLVLSSMTWVVYGNRRYAGPIKTMTRWTIGAEVDLPPTSSSGGGGGGVKKSTAVNPHASTTAHLGRSAHVWATSGDYAADGERDTAETGAWTAATVSRATEGSRVRSMVTTDTEAGSTDYSYDDDDDDDEDETDSEEGHADGESSPTDTLPRLDEEGRVVPRRS